GGGVSPARARDRDGGEADRPHPGWTGGGPDLAPDRASVELATRARHGWASLARIGDARCDLLPIAAGSPERRSGRAGASLGARRVSPATPGARRVRLRAGALDRPVLADGLPRPLREGLVRRLRGARGTVPRDRPDRLDSQPRPVGCGLGSLLRWPPTSGCRRQRR